MRNLVQQFLRREAHPVVQFVKYAMAGGLATIVDLGITFYLSWKVMPTLTSDDVLVRTFGLTIIPVEESTRAYRYFIICGVAFLFSNFVAYVANILWVFTPGRHSRAKEFTLFYLVSGFSFLVGTGLAAGLIQFLSFTTSYAKVANMFASVMINYVCRKFIIFKG
jgi:putative flippase GtrA